MVHANYCTPYPKQPCVVYEANMWCPCCCCGNYWIQGPIATQVSKALSRQSSEENHKRTRQGVSTKLESYIYRIHMVHATFLCLPHFLLKATMLYTCVLMSSFRSFYHILGLWCHIMWHVMWLRCHMPLHHH